jgi:hypothetical protein
MLRQSISHARLMRESTDRIEAALASSDGAERLVAQRVLESPHLWQQWEAEHSGLMLKVSNVSVQRLQVEALKETTFRLLHSKALFQYLRQRQIRGTERARVMAYFRPGRSYETAMIAEHGLYLRKACSYLCTHHVGAAVVQDPAFLDPLQRYEQLYTEYFEVYCNALTRGADPDGSQHSLLPLLKQQLNEYRLAILEPVRAQPFLRREADLRRRTGDTARLPVLRGPKGRR